MDRAVRIIIHGRVQGVGFRYHARLKGRELKLRGYVRNLPDGSVEVVVRGPQIRIDAFLVFCRRGSPVARVERVEVRELRPGEADGLQGFEIRR